MNPVLDALFGNRTAACVLLFLQCYGEGHAQRIAKTFGFGLNMTQRQLKRLEEQGVLVSRRLGNMRLFSFNERNPTVRNLRKLLEVDVFPSSTSLLRCSSLFLTLKLFSSTRGLSPSTKWVFLD